MSMSPKMPTYMQTAMKAIVFRTLDSKENDFETLRMFVGLPSESLLGEAGKAWNEELRKGFEAIGAELQWAPALNGNKHPQYMIKFGGKDSFREFASFVLSKYDEFAAVLPADSRPAWKEYLASCVPDGKESPFALAEWLEKLFLPLRLPYVAAPGASVSETLDGLLASVKQYDSMKSGGQKIASPFRKAEDSNVLSVSVMQKFNRPFQGKPGPTLSKGRKGWSVDIETTHFFNSYPIVDAFIEAVKSITSLDRINDRRIIRDTKSGKVYDYFGLKASSFVNITLPDQPVDGADAKRVVKHLMKTLFGSFAKIIDPDAKDESLNEKERRLYEKLAEKIKKANPYRELTREEKNRGNEIDAHTRIVTYAPNLEADSKKRNIFICFDPKQFPWEKMAEFKTAVEEFASAHNVSVRWSGKEGSMYFGANMLVDPAGSLGAKSYDMFYRWRLMEGFSAALKEKCGIDVPVEAPKETLLPYYEEKGTVYFKMPKMDFDSLADAAEEKGLHPYMQIMTDILDLLDQNRRKWRGGGSENEKHMSTWKFELGTDEAEMEKNRAKADELLSSIRGIIEKNDPEGKLNISLVEGDMQKVRVDRKMKDVLDSIAAWKSSGLLGGEEEEQTRGSERV